MMSIYTEYRSSSLFFVAFMMIMYFILLNIILAYFYYNYKEELIKEVRSFQKSTSRVFDDLFEKNGEDELPLSPDSVMSPKDSMWIQEEIGRIHKAEIKKIFETSIWKRAVWEALELQSVKFLFSIGTFIAFVLLIIQSSVVNPQPQSTYTPQQLLFGELFNQKWMLFELGINMFLFLDPFLRLITIGWRYFKELWFHTCDLIITFVIVFLLGVKLTFAENFPITVIRLLLIFRAFGFFRWVISFEKYKLIYDTLFKLIPLFLDLLGVLSIAFYFYSTLGGYLFGGYLKTNLTINFQEYGDPNYYVFVNFNDFAQGLYTCFHLLIVNNWLYTVDVHCRVMGSFNYRIFFVSFFVTVVVVCLNIMIAFILDIFVTQMAVKHRLSLERHTLRSSI